MVKQWGRMVGWGLGMGLACSLVGCGDKSDPDAVTNLELKSPTGLKIIDNGEGKVTLTWFTSNPEDDFEGYNIYGGQLTDAELTEIGVTKGKPLKLLDDSGEANPTIKTTILPKFDYTTSNESNALPGAAAAPTSEEEDTELSKLPIHQRNDADETDPLLPTCRPADGVCTLNTSATEVTSSTISSNGVVSFDLSSLMQLTEGKQYCFFVLSVQDGGKEVSEASSNVACVIPRYKVTFTNTISGDSYLDIRAYHPDVTDDEVSCDSSTHKCSDASIVSTNTGMKFQTNSIVSFTFIQGQPNKNLYIRRMGAFPTGFTGFSDIAPAFVYDSNKVAHGGGYSRTGQSVTLEPYGMYAIAVGDTTTYSEDSKFYYHYLWVNSTDVGKDKEISFELRLADQPGIR